MPEDTPEIRPEINGLDASAAAAVSPPPADPTPEPDPAQQNAPVSPTKVSAKVDEPASAPPKIPLNGNVDLNAEVEKAAHENNIPPGILHAEARQESHLKTGQTSSKGAEGVMQLMPRTAASLGVQNPDDPVENIHGGAKYLKQLHDRFGTWDKALAAYDWGPGNLHAAIQKHGGDWLANAPHETQKYVHDIMGAPVVGPVQTKSHGVSGSWEPEEHTLSGRVDDFFHMPSDQYDKKYESDDAETGKKIDNVLNHLIPFHKEMNQLQKSIEGTKAGKQAAQLVHDQLAHPEQLAMGGVEGPEGEIAGAIEGLAAGAKNEIPENGILSQIPGAITIKPPASQHQSLLESIPGAIMIKPPDMTTKVEIAPVQQAVEAAGGHFKGRNSQGLVEITLPRSLKDKLPGLSDRMKDFVSISMPEKDVTPESVKTAMDAKFKDFGGQTDFERTKTSYVSSEGKPYHEQNYPHEFDVTVHWPDGTSHKDGIKGLNQGHAMSRAKGNWPGATHIDISPHDPAKGFFAVAPIAAAAGAGSQKDESPIWQDPNIARHIASAWKESGNGQSANESSFVLTKDNPTVPIPMPLNNDFHKETFSLAPGTTAIFHTHPDSTNPEPSDADKKIADGHNVKIYVISSKGLSLYDPATKKVTWVADGAGYLPKNEESPKQAADKKSVMAATDALDPHADKKKAADEAMKQAWSATHPKPNEAAHE